MSCGLLYRRSPSSVSVLFSFRFCSFFVFIFIFCMAQASSTVRILALCKSFSLPRPAPPPSLRTPYSCPAKRINGADNGRGTWRLWEMSTGRGVEHARGREGGKGQRLVYSGKIPSINKSAAKFLSTRVAVDNAALALLLPISSTSA